MKKLTSLVLATGMVLSLAACGGSGSSTAASTTNTGDSTATTDTAAADESNLGYEYGEHAGLGFIQGEVCPLEPDLTDKSLKVPQIGWNALHIVKDDPLFQYIREGEYVYYVHSYYGKNCTESTLATSEYSIPVTGAVRAGKVYGTQFHPEKSGDTGLRILKAFAEL